MSQDPYPNERPDPYSADPYSSDPYVPGNREQRSYAAPLPTEPLPAPRQGPYGPPQPPPSPYAPTPPPNTSAIVLTIFAGLALMSGYCCYIGIPSLVFGILGITQQSSDPESAARMTRIGWICFASLTLLTLVGLGGFFLFVLIAGA